MEQEPFIPHKEHKSTTGMYAVVSEDKAQSSVGTGAGFIPHKEHKLDCALSSRGTGAGTLHTIHKCTTGMYAVVSEDKAQSSWVLEQEPFIPHKDPLIHKSTTGMYAVVSEDKAQSSWVLEQEPYS